MLSESSAFSGFSVADRSAALEFYRDLLGLPVTETPEGLRMELRGTTVFLYEKSDHAPASFTMLNFIVQNIDSTVDELSAKGVIFERYDMGPMQADEKNIYRGRSVGRGPDIAWFKDPSGNILSIIQES